MKLNKRCPCRQLGLDSVFLIHNNLKEKEKEKEFYILTGKPSRVALRVALCTLKQLEEEEEEEEEDESLSVG